MPRITFIEHDQTVHDVEAAPGESIMEAAINRVMHTYGMLENLTIEQERAARGEVTKFLAESKIADEHALAVEGVKFLRGHKPVKARRAGPEL